MFCKPLFHFLFISDNPKSPLWTQADNSNMGLGSATDHVLGV